MNYSYSDHSFLEKIKDKAREEPDLKEVHFKKFTFVILIYQGKFKRKAARINQLHKSSEKVFWNKGLSFIIKVYGYCNYS